MLDIWFSYFISCIENICVFVIELLLFICWYDKNVIYFGVGKDYCLPVLCFVYTGVKEYF